MTQSGGFISVIEAARRLNRSIEQVRRYLREGKLKGVRIGQQWFVEEASLAAVYQQTQRRLPSVREPAAVMEAPKMTRAEKMTKEEIEALFKRIDERVEALRKRLGGDLKTDIVQMIREDREAH